MDTKKSGGQNKAQLLGTHKASEMTVEQLFAGMAMQGLLANYTATDRLYVNDKYPVVAELSVELSKALIAELNK